MDFSEAEEPAPISLDPLVAAARVLFERAEHNLPSERRAASPASYDAAAFADTLRAAAQIPAMQFTLMADWPAATRALLPAVVTDAAAGPAWAPVLAWLLLRDLPCHNCSSELFDHFHLRGVLAEIFTALGLQGDDIWRAAARVRLLLEHGTTPEQTFASPAFWAEPDVRWLCGVNESDGVTWFNKEQFEEMWGWLQLPELVAIAERKLSAGDSNVSVELKIAAAGEFAAEAGFQLDAFLTLWKARTAEPEVAIPAVSGSFAD